MKRVGNDRRDSRQWIRSADELAEEKMRKTPDFIEKPGVVNNS
jgi:hypothetical protein